MSPRVPAVLALVLALLTGCCSPPSSETPAQGSVLLTVQVPRALPEYVSRVTVTVSGPDMASLSMDLAFNNGAWIGLLSDVPPGPHRTFSAQAFTHSTTPRFGGQVEDVTVTGHSTDLVNMGLQEDYSYVWPKITSGSQSSLTATLGQTLDFEVEAMTPSHAALTFRWESTTGTFSAATSDGTHSRVSWTAPFQCVIEGRNQVIRAIATNDLGYDIRRGFEVKGLPTCHNRGWTSVGLMNDARFLHASALLLDGRVLVTGGDVKPEGTAEVYEPANDTWYPTGPTSTSRQWHMAATLSDGRVLVAGGESWLVHELLKTAEVYDPATGVWSLTGSMASSHRKGVAMLLHDGRVLVVGGEDSGDVAPEVYEPSTGRWRLTSPTVLSRSSSTATLLADGRVLLVGGVSSPGTLTSAEVYDPITDTWSLTGSTALPHAYSHRATLLSDGRVLLTDGGGAEVYDPLTGTWSLTGFMSTWRSEHTATLLSTGKVLVTGGIDDDSYDDLGIYYATAKAEVYDPATGAWHPISSMYVRSSQGATANLLPSGKVLVVTVGSPAFRMVAEVYDPAEEP